MSSLAPTLEAYFTDRLIRQRRASPHTSPATGTPSDSSLATATGQPGRRHPGCRSATSTRRGSTRFLSTSSSSAGIPRAPETSGLPRSTPSFTTAHCGTPEHAALIQRVLAIPRKRAEKRTVTFLTPVETQALLDAPNRSTWAGRRDHGLLLTAVQTGLRVSELLGLTRADTQLGTGAHVRTVGKGRKERVAPLTRQTVAVLRVWLRETVDQPGSPLFPSRDGGTVTRDAIERRLAQHVTTAQQACPALRSKRVTMHTLRHTAAMNLLTAGVDTSTIALWLGHEQERIKHIYLHADLELKQRTLDRITPPEGRPGRYRAPDTLLAFLEGL